MLLVVHTTLSLTACQLPVFRMTQGCLLSLVDQVSSLSGCRRVVLTEAIKPWVGLGVNTVNLSSSGMTTYKDITDRLLTYGHDYG